MIATTIYNLGANQMRLLNSISLWPSWYRLLTICLSVAGCQTMLSDIVVCGPASLCLTKPAILSLPHCADNIDRDWSLTVIYRPLLANDVAASNWRVCHVPI